MALDVDDTLYLERDYVRSGFRAADAWVRRELGVDGFARRAWTAFERGVRGRIFDVALEECGVEPSPDLVGELVRVYRLHDPAIELLDDAAACLDLLVGRVTLAVVTDGPIDSQRAKARALGVDAWADVTVFTSELGDGFAKPHCRAFELVEQVTSCEASECVYLADNPAKDFRAPRSLGWVTVRVRRPQGLHARLASGPDVDAEIQDLSAFPAVVGLDPF